MGNLDTRGWVDTLGQILPSSSVTYLKYHAQYSACLKSISSISDVILRDTTVLVSDDWPSPS